MNYKSVALSIFLTQAHALDPIGQYLPGSDVVDHSLIDLDQKSMENAINNVQSFPNEGGMAIYEGGGHSKSFITLQLLEALPKDVAKKDEFSGVTLLNDLAILKVMEDTKKGSTTLRLLYEANQCQIGSLIDDELRNGCLLGVGNPMVTNGQLNLAYSLPTNIFEANTNGRTLQGFSTQVAAKMLDCGVGCPEVNAMEFFTYYGHADWADQWIQAANSGTATDFTNGNADFSQYGFDGKFEVIKKGTSYAVVLLYALHEFESSVAACKSGMTFSKDNDSAVHKWDEGVAFYVGSLAGRNGQGDDTGNKSGKVHWALAQKRCKDFGTCGPNGDLYLEGGIAQVNFKQMNSFTEGRNAITNGQCEVAGDMVKKISTQAYIPLIQGTIRYAHKVEAKDTGEKGQAEGAVFAAGVLPHIYAQGDRGKAAAQIIYDNMMVSSNPQTSFAAVKGAFESVYDLLGIDCEMVGGYSNDQDEYYAVPDATPCATPLDDPSAMFQMAGVRMISCKELNNIGDYKDTVCKQADAMMTCPATCNNKIECTDKRTGKFNKGKNKKMSCNQLSKITLANRVRLCKKRGARNKCPVTCREFCLFTNPLTQ